MTALVSKEYNIPIDSEMYNLLKMTNDVLTKLKNNIQ